MLVWVFWVIRYLYAPSALMLLWRIKTIIYILFLLLSTENPDLTDVFSILKPGVGQDTAVCHVSPTARNFFLVL